MTTTTTHTVAAILLLCNNYKISYRAAKKQRCYVIQLALQSRVAAVIRIIILITVWYNYTFNHQHDDMSNSIHDITYCCKLMIQQFNISMLLLFLTLSALHCIYALYLHHCHTVDSIAGVTNIGKKYISQQHQHYDDNDKNRQKKLSTFLIAVVPSSDTITNTNSILAGCIALLYHSSHTHAHDTLEIRRLYVHPFYRRHGIATSLLNEVKICSKASNQ